MMNTSGEGEGVEGRYSSPIKYDYFSGFTKRIPAKMRHSRYAEWGGI